MSTTVRTPIQTHLLIHCFADYADRQGMENLYLRFIHRELREIYDLAKQWKEAAQSIAVWELTGGEVPELARQICREREAQLFIAIDLIETAASRQGLD